MIQFNELKITPAGTNMIIDVSVKSDKYYEDIYISKILIDTSATFITSGPSSTPVYSKAVTDGIKTIRLILSEAEVLASLKNDFFIIYIDTNGTPSADTPCGEDNKITIGAVCNMQRLYQYMFGYIREMESSCSIPKGFINSILQFKAFQLSIKLGHYINSIKYWNKFYATLKDVPSINCGCNGRAG